MRCGCRLRWDGELRERSPEKSEHFVRTWYENGICDRPISKTKNLHAMAAATMAAAGAAEGAGYNWAGLKGSKAKPDDLDEKFITVKNVIIFSGEGSGKT